MIPAQIAADLDAAIGEGLQLLQGADEDRTTRRLRPGGWCAREVVGHLIDSACNNHRRFVVGRSPGLKTFDGYDQDEWVAAQHYDQEEWRNLVPLWAAYNRHLAHVIARTPVEILGRAAAAPGGHGEVTVEFLMSDYVRHLRHHLAQLRTLLAE